MPRIGTSDLRGQDVIDSRDVIARIDYLNGLRQEALDKAQEDDTDPATCWTAEDGSVYGETDDWTEDEEQELKALEGLAEDASRSPDWKYGEAIIADSYFQEYAQQLAEDIGAINRNATWPNDHIDWESAADALKADYISVQFGGEEYWIRA